MALLILRGLGVLAGLVLAGGGAMAVLADGMSDNVSDSGRPFAALGIGGVVVGLALIGSSIFA